MPEPGYPVNYKSCAKYTIRLINIHCLQDFSHTYGAIRHNGNMRIIVLALTLLMAACEPAALQQNTSNSGSNFDGTPLLESYGYVCAISDAFSLADHKIDLEFTLKNSGGIADQYSTVCKVKDHDTGAVLAIGQRSQSNIELCDVNYNGAMIETTAGDTVIGQWHEPGAANHLRTVEYASCEKF